MTIRLSKSRFVAGWKCHRLLWLKVHEPDAPELVPDLATQDRFEQGNEVGLLAQAEFPDGVFIDLPYNQYQEKIEATRQALADEAPAIFEASFTEDGVFVAVDVLERTDDGFTLIEVKSSSSLKPEHIPDAAIQVHVLRAAGLPVSRVELMHLNKGYRRPDVGSLFVREDITEKALDFLPCIPDELGAMREMLRGDFPDLPLNLQCSSMRDCPFLSRCWPTDRDHVLSLHGKGVKKALPLIKDGFSSVLDISEDMDGLSAVARRQVRAVRANAMIVESGLGKALDELESPIGFLDFETISRALPPWDGFGPWSTIPVQLSYHELGSDGQITHTEWLAEGPENPTGPLARALVAACLDARHVLTYTTYERTQIKTLIRHVPEMAAELRALIGRLVDLKDIVQNYVYHPDFQGSLSIKQVLPALVPDLGYDDLAIQEGMGASVDIARMMLRPESFEPGEREQLRIDLLAYCERDTWAMVKLLEKLGELVS